MTQLYTAAREGEVCSLRFSSFDTDAPLVHFRAQDTKARVSRSVYCPPELREVLESAAESEMGTSMSRVVAREREVKAMSGLGRSLADDQDQDERVFHREEKQQRSSLLSPGSDKGSSKALKKHAIGDDVADAALDAAFKRAAKTKGGLAPTSISVAINGSGTTGAAGGSEEKSAQNRDKGTKRKGRDDEHGHKKKSKKEKREKERR